MATQRRRDLTERRILIEADELSRMVAIHLQLSLAEDSPRHVEVFPNGSVAITIVTGHGKWSEVDAD